MTYAAFAFDALASVASLVAIILALKAYKVSVRAYEVSANSYVTAKEQNEAAKEQHLKTLELDVLRDLIVYLDEPLRSARSEEYVESAGRIPMPNTEAYARLLLLPAEEELPLWLKVYAYHLGQVAEAEVLEHPLVTKRLQLPRLPFDRRGEDQRTMAYVVAALHEEVMVAIRRRTGLVPF